LSLVAGALAQQGLSVLGGSVYTRDDGVAVDVLHVRASDAAATVAPDSVREAVTKAVEGHTDLTVRFDRRLRLPVRVAGPASVVLVNNTESEQYSIVEVRTADRPWLLYAITRALADANLDIHLAKVDTIGRDVIDAFYVLRANGRRLEDADEVDRLVRRLLQAIDALDR
jgi:[protein-PII] uridylyltransferase